MTRIRLVVTVAMAACLAACSHPVPAKAPAATNAGLKTLDNPGGGAVVFGPLTGQASLRDGMAFMLHQVHDHFGGRPQIGKLFQVRGSNSVATFFTLTATTMGNRPVSGLAIVSMADGTKPAAAVLYDDSAHFGASEPQLMRLLNEAWGSSDTQSRPAGSPAQVQATPPQAPEALREVRFSDNSGVVGLPDGWQMTNSGGGGVHALGPNGESIHLGVILQNIYDPNNPRSNGMIQYMQMARQPVAIYPYDGNLVDAVISVAQQNHRNQNLPVPTFDVLKVVPLPPTQYETRVVYVTAKMDAHDGKGMMLTRMRVGSFAEGPAGGWAITVNQVSAPEDRAAAEGPTLAAILASYRQNGQVIFSETGAVIRNIQALSAANTKAANDIGAERDRVNADVEGRWDDNAKYNQTFRNYQMDQSVIQDNEGVNDHATMDDAPADALVRSDPNRYQYVPTQDMLKGIDY